MEAHELTHAALEWTKSNGYAQRAQEEQVPLKDAYAEVRRLREENKDLLETGKTLDATQARIQELERERNGILSLNDELANERNALKWQLDEARKVRRIYQERVEELEAELSSTLSAHKERDTRQRAESANAMLRQDITNLKRDLDAAKVVYIEDIKGYERDRIAFEQKIGNLEDKQNDLRCDLDADKDARIIAEKEAADLRAWRKGLVKPGTEEPKKGNHVVVLNEAGDIYLERTFPLATTARRWFDPREIFATADPDAEKEGE